MNSSGVEKNTGDCIEVMARFRPMNAAEEAIGSRFVVTFPSREEEKETKVKLAEKVYQFDHVFLPNCSQEEVYNIAASNIVHGYRMYSIPRNDIIYFWPAPMVVGSPCLWERTGRKVFIGANPRSHYTNKRTHDITYGIPDVLNGKNGTIFAYGQSSSGKTTTMTGTLGDPQMEGITPKVIRDIFNYISAAESSMRYTVKISYFEIYMEKIIDLQDNSKVKLVIQEKAGVPFVSGLTERLATTPEEAFKILCEGDKKRHTARTNLNGQSSRSHGVFSIKVMQENAITMKKLSGSLYLVDLSGSEKVSKTGAKGTTLDEAKNINRSLSTLGNVINALAEGLKSHIPYRDSKLTRILKQSLGGNSRATIIICCSPSTINESETKSTLDFGMRAKTIKNVISINEEMDAMDWKRCYEMEKELVRQLKEEKKKLEFELQNSLTSLDSSFGSSVLSLEEFEIISSTGLSDTQSCSMCTFRDEEVVVELKKQLLEQEKIVSRLRKEKEDLCSELDSSNYQRAEQENKVQKLSRALEEKEISDKQFEREIRPSHPFKASWNRENLPFLLYIIGMILLIIFRDFFGFQVGLNDIT